MATARSSCSVGVGREVRGPVPGPDQLLEPPAAGRARPAGADGVGAEDHPPALVGQPLVDVQKRHDVLDLP